MRKLSVLLVLLLILTVGVLPAAAITWGQPDTEHTNVGAMLVDWPDSGLGLLCSGTLIHPRVFLTAGHCTDYVEASGVEDRVWVTFNANLLERFKKWKVADVVTHPDYNWGPTSDPHDVGVLILEKPVKGHQLKPATLPEPGFLDDLEAAGELRQGSDGAKFVVVGYGAQEWLRPGFAWDGLRRVAESEYLKLLKAWLLMSQNRATSDSGTCFGDSGGPAFWTEPDGTEILVGITSWGDAVCVATGFDYRVDIPDTLEFIKDVIDGL